MHSGAGNAVEQRDLLQKHLRHLAGITRLPLQFVDRARDANVRVFFASKQELKTIAMREMSATARRSWGTASVSAVSASTDVPRSRVALC